MKKLLNIVSKKWARMIFAVCVALLIIVLTFSSYKSEVKTESKYDYHYYDTYKNGMPSYGLRKRKNILAQMKFYENGD